MAITKKGKLVTVETNGTLVELGGISGPIINPCFIDETTIIRMVGNNKKVYEVNPANHAQKVRLNLKNVKTDNFKVVTNEAVQAKAQAKSTKEATKSTQKVEENGSDFTKK